MNFLYDYQIKAVEQMKNGCILCGGVGSGKSRTSLSYYYKENGGDIYRKNPGKMDNPKDLYIITTARKRDTLEWEKELSIFYISKIPGEGFYQNKVVVDSWNNIKKYIDVKNAFFIFDEQRVIGNGSWVKAFLKISKRNDWILLSATPGDCWQDYIPVFLANGFYRNRSEFISEHVIYDRFSKFPKVNKYINVKKLIRLRDSLLIDMDFKRDSVRVNRDVMCEYDRQLYKMVMKERWNPYLEQPIENAANLCYVLRKVVNSNPSRCDAILDIFERHSRVIVFYNFNYELDALHEMAEKLVGMEGFEYAEWNGHLHQPVPTCDSWLYFVQYTAGAEAWNCITTNCIAFYSQNYSYKVMEQSSGRIDRVNTPFPKLYYYHLRSTANIDIAIMRAIKQKKNFNERGYISKL